MNALLFALCILLAGALWRSMRRTRRVAARLDASRSWCTAAQKRTAELEDRLADARACADEADRRHAAAVERAEESERRLLMSRALVAGEREARIAAEASAADAQKRLDDARATMLAVAEAAAADAAQPAVAYAGHPHQVFGLVVEVICDHMALPFGYLFPAQQPGERDRVFVTRWGSA